MRRGADFSVQLPGLYLVHHNVPGKRVDRHRHDDHHLFVPLQGEIEVRLAGGALRAGPGRMLYVPAGAEHEFTASTREGERLIALIDADGWRRAGGAPDLGPRVAPTSQVCKELLFHVMLHPETRHARALIDVLIQVLGEALEAAPGWRVEHAGGRARDPRARRAIEFMEAHLGETMTTARIARAAGTSARSLERLLVSEVGLAPRAFLTRLRVARAEALLSDRQTSVTEASLAVGYRSLSQFITAFRQLTGRLPSDVRRGGGIRQVFAGGRRARGRRDP
jgi:AraC-like DNA-binding protein